MYSRTRLGVADRSGKVRNILVGEVQAALLVFVLVKFVAALAVGDGHS